ncbi:phosphoribosylformylglycinamidine synthase subunit PurS [Acidianus ambivalens]|uniref:Phosphoribosylformylglycinamidine synthase PurS protein n=1 Tax=Acidianus ambivalens TaxID=2283 RepID=A0A650CYC2_ACIAM|nr:phosphoribosylformylglycinamidine synthase subunit PurS [Acidianus ambivalens]MQL55107.1 phosphoribosylformylglycinamidine synthase PurS protein [Acidianus ambivalens]QGR22808.1 phosphoribosylformylglycinamidine synthase PurS protein [Acidianus ambivalens]
MIINKEGIRDPEGETIKNYIVNKVTDKVKEVRAGKYLSFSVDVKEESEAIELVKKIAYEDRLYNPIVHKIIVRAEKIENGGN